MLPNVSCWRILIIQQNWRMQHSGSLLRISTMWKWFDLLFFYLIIFIENRPMVGSKWSETIQNCAMNMKRKLHFSYRWFRKFKGIGNEWNAANGANTKRSLDKGWSATNLGSIFSHFKVNFLLGIEAIGSRWKLFNTSFKQYNCSFEIGKEFEYINGGFVYKVC